MKNVVMMLILLVLFSGCSSDSNQVKMINGIKQAVQSVKNDTKTTSDNFRSMYREVKSKTKMASGLVKKADSTFMAISEAVSFLDSLTLLVAQEDDSRHGTSVLSDAATENAINARMRQLRNSCKAGLADKTKQHAIDSVLKTEMANIHRKGWAKDEFGNTTSDAAIARLNTLKAHCEAAADITLKDINDAGNKH